MNNFLKEVSDAAIQLVIGAQLKDIYGKKKDFYIGNVTPTYCGDVIWEYPKQTSRIKRERVVGVAQSYCKQYLIVYTNSSGINESGYDEHHENDIQIVAEYTSDKVYEAVKAALYIYEDESFWTTGGFDGLSYNSFVGLYTKIEKKFNIDYSLPENLFFEYDTFSEDDWKERAELEAA